MIRFKTALLKIVGRIKEMATFWTSIGVMFIPIGLAILISWPKAWIGAYLVMFAGLVCAKNQ